MFGYVFASIRFARGFVLWLSGCYGVVVLVVVIGFVITFCFVGGWCL